MIDEILFGACLVLLVFILANATKEVQSWQKKKQKLRKSRAR